MRLPHNLRLRAGGRRRTRRHLLLLLLVMVVVVVQSSWVLQLQPSQQRQQLAASQGREGSYLCSNHGNSSSSSQGWCRGWLLVPGVLGCSRPVRRHLTGIRWQHSRKQQQGRLLWVSKHQA
jgi:hypothetical protein